ncbi:MAG TPA: alkaline phosphatase family protein [Opitutaceae bacterium]|jgi:hypothetical protein
MIHSCISPVRGSVRKFALAGACAFGLLLSARAQTQVGPVFYILMENRNFTTNGDLSGGSVLVGNPAAPYINSLITPGNPNAKYVSWASAYHNVLATASGNNAAIHPSEPNYLWMESGSNFGVFNDNDPYGSTMQVQFIHNFQQQNPDLSTQNFSGLLQTAGISWRSYQEDIDLQNTTGGNGNQSGLLSSSVMPMSQWTVPLASFSGKGGTYVNPYNGSNQWNFAVKHNGSLFFPITNGSTITTANLTPSNPFATVYRPMQQFAADLQTNDVARYNVITPDQYNDMHTALNNGINYAGQLWTGDSAQVAQGDNFLSIVVPEIMASPAWQNNGVIVIWTDETEGTNRDDFSHTLEMIVISKLAKGNAYVSTFNFTHSSDLNTMQKLFQVTANTPSGYLNDAASASNSAGAAAGSASGFGTGTAYDLSDLFQADVIPAAIPVVGVSSESGYVINRRLNTVTQTVTVRNLLTLPVTTPIYLAIGDLSSNTSLINAAGTTQNYAPFGSPYVVVSADGLRANGTKTVTLQFAIPASGKVTDQLTAITTSGTP